MNANTIIVYAMVFFALLGAADRITGNRLKLGENFEEGVKTIGTLTITTAGILILAPALGDVLKPVLTPFCRIIHVDPAVLVGILIDMDIGGAPLAKALAFDEEGFILGGILTASMMGAAITFTIPVGMELAKEEYRGIISRGIMIGIITVPIGVIIGGFVAGISFSRILPNIVIILIISVIMIIGIMIFEKTMVKIFVFLGRVILAASIFGIGIGIISEFTVFHPFRNAMDLEEAIAIIGNVAMILGGAYVLVALIRKFFQRPLSFCGRLIGINDTSAAGFIVTLANNIPLFKMIEDMDEKGAVMNIAFAVSGAFTFGDHMGFAAGYAPEAVAAMAAGKLTAAIAAGVLAWFIETKRNRDETHRQN